MELAEKRRQIAFQVVRASLWVTLLAAGGFLLFFMLADQPAGADLHVRNVRLGATALLLCGAASGLVLLARGLLVAAIIVFASILYAGPMIPAIAAGFGVYVPSMALWPVLILLFGLVWGSAAAVGVTALLAASIIGLVLAQLGGVLPGQTLAVVDSPAFFGSLRVLLLVLICWLTVSYARIYSAALDAATRTRQELAANERELRAVIETEPECVKVLGLDGSLRQMNRAGLDMIEADSIDQVLGKSILGVVAPPYREAFAALNERVERGESGMLEFEVIGLKGGHRWLETHAVPMRDGDGKITALLGVTRDITERRQSEQALAESESRFREIFNAVSDGIFIHDAETGHILDVNRGMCEMYGLSREAALACGPDDLSAGTPPYSADEVAEKLRLARSVGPQTFDWLARAGDGHHFWVEVSLRFVTIGNQQRFLAVVRDITTRKRMELSLNSLQEMLRSAVSAARVFPWEWDIATDRLVWAVPPDLLLGPPRDAEAGYPDFRRLVHPQDLDAFRAAGQRSLASGVPYRCEFRVVATDGCVRWVAARGEVLRGADGRIERLIGASLDITERKSLLEDLERHRSHLEEMVAERTAELVAAQAEAERLGRAKSEFLANMSHEIRTPLNAVLGLSRIGARDSTEKSREIFERIEKSGEHLLGVINDVLDFSKLDAGKFDIERRPFNLAGAIDTAVSFVNVEASRKGLTFEATVAADLPQWVTGDVQRLQQILVNLLANAVKFTERGEVRLRVAREGEDIYFKVIDTGIGLTEKQIARLFQPFEQADSSTTRKYGGTGLGLAISRNLASLMGGEITVDSTAGAGCCFTLRLPLPKAEPDLPAHAAAQAASRRLAGLRLLAAEDVEVNRVILEDLLIHEGAHVIFAEDGQQALDRLEEAGVSAFDAVLMDVQMPVMDGLEATRRLRRMAPTLPVIGLTAHAFAEERDKCLAAGMVEHVIKPIDNDTLVAAILRHARPVDPIPLLTSPLKGEELDSLPFKGRAGEGMGLGMELASSALDTAVPPAPTFAAESAAAGLIDWTELLARYAGREGFVAKLAAIAVDSQRNTPAQLRAAAAKQDLQAMAFIAHGIKGIAGNLMAHGLQDLATRAEIAARKDEPQTAALAAELANQLEALLAELAAHLGEDLGKA